jgi:4,5-DOPA dioxygenase extradiol
MTDTTRILFLSHGGGPMPLLGDPGHQEMVECLTELPGEIARPAAIIVISAHWEASLPSITAGANPALIYDYYGFPEESYQIGYPCPGNPALAAQLHTALDNAGITSRLDESRGFDHGLFVPLKIMYPEADIPCIQLSLVSSLDPAEHIRIGRALQNLDCENLLVIGSGFSFHNMRAFFAPETAESRTLNENFEGWLAETCGDPDLTEHDRAQRLIDWDAAPGARYCHPREEHLLPLHVCYGLAEKPCSEVLELRILNKKASMVLW